MSRRKKPTSEGKLLDRIERARELAAQSHATAVRSLAEATRLAPAVALAGGAGQGGAAGHPTDELERIADFIYTRTS